MPINRSQIVDALDANLNEMYQDGLKAWPEEYSKIFNVGSSDQAQEIDSYESGFGLTPIKPEGIAATYDVIYPGIKTTYINLTYALGYEITEEAIEDNLRTPETFNKLPQALSRSGVETVEITAANILNTGLDASVTGYDGVALFATTHVNADASTWSNRPAVEVDLSVSSLTAALTAIEAFTDERGLKRPTKAVLLVIPVDLWNVAEELLGSEFKPYVANNEVNALQKKDLQYFVSHYLTDADAWCVLAEKENHALKFFWRVKPGALRRGTDFDSTNLKHLQRMRFSVGYSHARGTYGTSGG